MAELAMSGEATSHKLINILQFLNIFPSINLMHHRNPICQTALPVSDDAPYQHRNKI